MAVFKMGALVTEMAGSVGGTSFRRFRGSFVMYNKSLGGAKSKLLSNHKLAYLGWLFRQWRSLGNDVKHQWKSEADKYTFPDKFGVNRILSPKDFFVKMNGNLSAVNQYFPAADNFDANLCVYNLARFRVDIDDKRALIEINMNNLENFFLFQCVVSNKYPFSFVFDRKKLTSSTRNNDNFEIDIFDELIAQFPNIAAGNFVTLYHQSMSLYGMRSVKSATVIQVT